MTSSGNIRVHREHSEGGGYKPAASPLSPQRPSDACHSRGRGLPGRAQGDGAVPSTFPEPAPDLVPALRPPHAHARTTFPRGLSGVALRALELGPQPRRPDRGTAPPPGSRARAAPRRRTLLSGGRRPDSDRERDGKPGPPAVRVGFAAVRACKPRAVRIL